MHKRKVAACWKLRCTSAKLLPAEQTHMTHYHWTLQSEQMHQNTNQNEQKYTRARLAEWKAKSSTHGSIENYQPKVTEMDMLLLRLANNATWIWSYDFSKETKLCFIENLLALDHADQLTDMQNCCWPRRYQPTMTSACSRQTQSWLDNSPSAVWTLLERHN